MPKSITRAKLLKFAIPFEPRRLRLPAPGLRTTCYSRDLSELLDIKVLLPLIFTRAEPIAIHC